MVGWQNSLLRRVSAAAIASTALGGLIAVAVAILSVDWLIAQHADRRLMAATTTLAWELDEEQREQDDSLQEVLTDENGEIVTSGIRLALYQGRALVAGDAWVPSIPPNRCVTRGELGSRTRACSRAYQVYTIVAAESRDDETARWFYLIAAMVAIGVGAAFGGVVGISATRWALRPLLELTARIEQLKPADPDPSALARPLGVAEVDALRVTLHEALLRVHAHVARLERFAADAAHELRTPLTLLSGELELLAEETHDSQAAARLASAVARVTRLAELTESLLLLALPLSSVKLDFQAVALADIISEVVADLPPVGRGRIRTHAAAEGLVRGEAVLLRVLVRNALDNALKYSDAEVQIFLEEQAANVVFTVSDTGPGIREELRQRVFEPFFRGEPDATAGHGLGLALLGHIARAHAAEVRLGQRDQGSTLQIHFPAWAVTGSRAPAPDRRELPS